MSRAPQYRAKMMKATEITALVPALLMRILAFILHAMGTAIWRTANEMTRNMMVVRMKMKMIATKMRVVLVAKGKAQLSIALRRFLLLRRLRLFDAC